MTFNPSSLWEYFTASSGIKVLNFRQSTQIYYILTMYQALGQTSGLESFKVNKVTALFNLTTYVKQLSIHCLT